MNFNPTCTVYNCTQRTNTQYPQTLHIFYAVVNCYNFTFGMICTCAGKHVVIHAVFYERGCFDHSRLED